MNRYTRLSWYALLACVVLAPLATTATSMLLRSLPLTFDQFVLPKLVTLGILTAVALASWAVGTPSELRWSPAGTVLAAFLGFATLSTGLALDPAVAFFGKDAANGLVAYLCYGAVFFLVLQLARTAGATLQLARAVVASGAVASVFSLYQATFMTSERVAELGLGAVGYLYGRGGGLFGNPDYVGAFLVVPFILALVLTFAEQDRRIRIAAGFALALIGSAELVAQVRGGWLGVVAGLVVLGVLQYRRARPGGRALAIGAGIVVAALAMGLLIAGPGLVLDRVTSGLDGGLNAFSGDRIQGWGDAIDVIGSRPLLGTGPDSFSLGWYQVVERIADPDTGVATYFEDPHNLPLAVTATIGIPAIIALVAFIALAIRSGAAALRTTAGAPDKHALYAGWMAALAGLLVASLFGVSTIPLNLLLFVVAAVLVTPTASVREIEPGWALGVRSATGVLAAVVLVGSTVPFIADFHLGQFKRTGIEASLQRARSLSPWSRTIQNEYLDYRASQIIPLLPSGGPAAEAAVDAFDAEAFAITQAHPYELEFVLKRTDLLGQVAGQLGGAYPDKAFTVINLAVLDFPKLEDLQIARAQSLNNLDRYDESIEVLEALPAGLRRDAALIESYLLAKREADARSLTRTFAERYAGTELGDAFLSQPSIAPYLAE